MSPRKKKTKLGPAARAKIKRELESTESNKRRKSDSTTEEEEKKSKKRKNFVTACEQVSLKEYMNYSKRFSLLHFPKCSNSSLCTHQNTTMNIVPIPTRIEESFKIEMKSNSWCEALEICSLSISPTQYLSHTILKDVVEIMMNAHEDTSSKFTMSNLLDQCQQVLSLNFNMHPPCMVKSIRKCYLKFLTSPMDLKENTFTNRSEFNCDKGIIKYCFNRLEHELSYESKDEALVDKFENTPDNMKQSVQGLHWQKEKFEIFELLNRSDRIERLMSVLETVIELLQFDVVIWHSRYTNNLGNHIMRSHRPLMAHILWSSNILYTGAVNINCRQILRIFVYFIHLQYPEHHIKTMTIWLNTMIQTFYICENNSNSNYPNTGKYCNNFANELFKIISEMPPSTILRILERIKPTFMRYLVSKQYLNTILSTDEEEIIKVLIKFIERSEWKHFPESNEKPQIPKTLKVPHIKPNKLLTYLSKTLTKTAYLVVDKKSDSKVLYPKFIPLEDMSKEIIDQKYVVLLIFITFHAYLDAFSVQEVQETLDKLNEQLDQEIPDSDKRNNIEVISYSVTEDLIKKYRSIYQMLKDLILLLQRKKGEIPDIIHILFEALPLLGL
ncbi:uncharacterized protein LOC119831385 isoform X1 [Zerene cesonia]|uniref:uncharacterized protein LOC119831385 isoform X1 n=2 Tax=Zerene cesonia TaxID=33412 RepID=UPI0018E52FF7|nr:uncharacterized protein LOC119831385 isoform X1 [Zerene cesonia]